MSVLLSPTKPVRTRFKVPGEGAYELSIDHTSSLSRNASPAIASPSVTITASPSITSTASSSSSQPNAASASSSASAPTKTQVYTAGNPLGLARICKLSYAPRASLQPDASSPNSNPNQYNLSSASASTASNTTASSSSTSTTTTSSLFSFRKLTQLGPALGLSKLTANTNEEDNTSQVSQPQSRSSSVSDPIHPRAPPRIATTATPTADSTSTSDNNNENNTGTSTDGVLVYNIGESLVLLDVHTRSTLDLPLTNWARAPHTAHALTYNDGVLRCIVGLANGEILYFSDVHATAISRKNRANSESGNATSGGVGAGLLSSSAASVIVGAVSNGGIGGGTPPVVYNREGGLNLSRVVALRWFPIIVSNTNSLKFAAVHADGVVIIHDAKQKPAVINGRTAQQQQQQQSDEVNINNSSKIDANGSSPNGNINLGTAGMNGGNGNSDLLHGSERNSTSPSHRRSISGVGITAATMGPFDVLISRQIKGKRVVVSAGGGNYINNNGNANNNNNNATTIWQLGRASAATACDVVEYTPDDRSANMKGNTSILLGVAGRDGYLRVVDVVREMPVMALRSYFGALLCVAWSPDGRYVAAGGEDDLISIWSVADEKLVARLEGHTSWVSAIAWDYTMSKSTVEGKRHNREPQKRYRLGSAGQDAKLLLWDFELDALVYHRIPSTSTGNSNGGLKRSGSGVIEKSTGGTRQLRSLSQSQRRDTGTGSGSGSGSGWKTGKLGRLRGNGQNDADQGSGICSMPVVVPAPGRAQIPCIEPIAVHVAHGEPLTDVWFDGRGVFTADALGSVKLWARPPQCSVPELCLGQGRVTANTDSGNLSNKQGLSQLLSSANSDLD